VDKNVGLFAILFYEIVGLLKVLAQIKLFVVVGWDIQVVLNDGLIVLKESTSRCTNYGSDVVL
jgi:hypothetical protein